MDVHGSWKRGGAAALTLGSVLLVAGTARADGLTDLGTAFEDALSSGSWGLALGVAFVAGLVTSLTPCVYPMIAITVSVFGATEAKSKLHAAGLSTMYLLGMMSLFTVLGLVSGLFELDSSQLYGNVWLWAGMAAILFVLSLAMFGVYELRLPGAVQNKLAQMGGIGPRGAFVLGMVGGLIATPCTGPVLGGLLVWIGTTGSPVFGALMLSTFALGLGLLTWLVGTFAVSLPKSGPWMDGVKSVLGLGLVVTGLFFLLNNAFPSAGDVVEKTTPFIAGGLASAVLGVAIGAIHVSVHGATKLQLARKISGLVLTAAGLATVVLWLNAAPPLEEGAQIVWMDDYDAARELADTENMPLIVDFGASWCGACEEMERHTFSDRRVIAEGRRFVSVRIDLSPGEDVARGRALLATYEQRGLPLVVLHGSNGEEAARITSFVEAEQMLQTMRAVR